MAVRAAYLSNIKFFTRNDAASILDMSLSVYEHESTVCPNMPLRALIYVTNILEQCVKKQNIYGRKLAAVFGGIKSKLQTNFGNRPEEAMSIRLDSSFFQAFAPLK